MDVLGDEEEFDIILSGNPPVEEKIEAKPIEPISEAQSSPVGKQEIVIEPIQKKEENRESTPKSPSPHAIVQEQVYVNASEKSANRLSTPSNAVSSLMRSVKSTTPTTISIDEEEKKKLQDAQNQWDNLSVVRQEQNYGKSSGIKEKNPREKLISYKEAYDYFTSIDLSKEKDLVYKAFKNEGVVTIKNANIASKLFGALRGTPVLATKTLESEREFVFAVAKVPLDHTNVEHERIMFSIYRKLTGDAVNCPSLGSHWEIIGFQGANPATDLRGLGMFGPLQLLYFIGKYPSVAADIFKLSQIPEQIFPMAVVSLNMSAMALELLREGKLSAHANKIGTAVHAVHDMYSALFLKFYQLWKREKRTIVDYDSTKKWLREYCKKNAAVLIKNLHDETSSEKKSSEKHEYIDL